MASAEQQAIAKLQSQVSVGGLYTLAAGYAQLGEDLPPEVVRAIRFTLRGYPDTWGLAGIGGRTVEGLRT